MFTLCKKILGFFILLVAWVSCQEKKVSFHVSRLYNHYTCEELITSLLQETDSPGLSLAYFSEFISSLNNPPDEDADKNAANALALLTPFGETQQLNYDIWNALFYGCNLKDNGDNIIQRIYRLGLIRCARMLSQKGLYDVSHYVYSRTEDGENLLHLAVRSGNPELITLLADVLHENMLLLMEGDLAVNNNRQTPEGLARELKRFGSLDAFKGIYVAYQSFKDIPRPPLPRTPYIAGIQLVSIEKVQNGYPNEAFTSEDKKKIQLDLTDVSFASQTIGRNRLLYSILCFTLYVILIEMFG